MDNANTKAWVSLVLQKIGMRIKEEMRSGHPQSINFNSIIRREKETLKMWLWHLRNQVLSYSVTSIVNALTKDTPSTMTLSNLFEERIEFFKSVAEQFNTATGYRILLNVIKRYTDNNDIELFEVDSAWLETLKVILEPSIRKFFDCLKAIMNYAVSKNT